jgi:hypothetical protein
MCDMLCMTCSAPHPHTAATRVLKALPIHALAAKGVLWPPEERKPQEYTGAAMPCQVVMPLVTSRWSSCQGQGCVAALLLSSVAFTAGLNRQCAHRRSAHRASARHRRRHSQSPSCCRRPIEHVPSVSTIGVGAWETVEMGLSCASCVCECVRVRER